MNRASALPCGPATNPLRDHQTLIHKVAQFGEADRKTVDEFARENQLDSAQMRNLTEATGKLNCGGFNSTAQVTLRNNVITTAAHAFEGNCRDQKKVALNKCFFVLDGSNKKYKVKRSLAQGYSCPADNKNHDDWAVLLLNDSVEGIKPLAVDYEAANAARINSKAIALGHSADFFPQGYNGPAGGVKHVGECRLLYVDRGFPQALAASDCDLSYGASGGPLLTRQYDSPKFIGIATSISVDGEQERESIRARRTNVYEANNKNYALHILVSGQFAEALRRVESAGDY